MASIWSGSIDSGSARSYRPAAISSPILCASTNVLPVNEPSYLNAPRLAS